MPIHTSVPNLSFFWAMYSSKRVLSLVESLSPARSQNPMLKHPRTLAWGGIVACVASACASTNSDVQMIGLVFDQGAETAELKGQISGEESVMYRFQARDGQFLSVGLRPNSQDAEFVLYAPGEWPGEVLFASQTAGGRSFQGQIETDGAHAVKVFQSRQASHGGRASPYEIEITLRD